MHNRGFEDIKDNDFKTAELQTELGENTEVYGKFSADKRVRTFLASRAKIYNLPNERHSRTNDNGSKPKRQKNFIAGDISLIRPAGCQKTVPSNIYIYIYIYIYMSPTTEDSARGSTAFWQWPCGDEEDTPALCESMALRPAQIL